MIIIQQLMRANEDHCYIRHRRAREDQGGLEIGIRRGFLGKIKSFKILSKFSSLPSKCQKLSLQGFIQSFIILYSYSLELNNVLAN